MKRLVIALSALAALAVASPVSAGSPNLTTWEKAVKKYVKAPGHHALATYKPKGMLCGCSDGSKHIVGIVRQILEGGFIKLECALPVFDVEGKIESQTTCGAEWYALTK